MFLGQTFEFASGRDMAMKLRMRHKFCSKPPVAFDKVEVPKKAMTMGERQLNEYKRTRKVHN